MTNKHNPWNTAAWGKTYDLAGYEWTPGSLPFGDPAAAQRTVMIDEAGSLRTISAHDIGFYGIAKKGRELPLLPAPDGLTREQAIAALERAGFVRKPNRLAITISIGKTNQIVIENDGTVAASAPYETDPTLAQYAVDCFSVIKQWCSKVNWSVQDG